MIDLVKNMWIFQRIFFLLIIPACVFTSFFYIWKNIWNQNVITTQNKQIKEWMELKKEVWNIDLSDKKWIDINRSDKIDSKTLETFKSDIWIIIKEINTSWNENIIVNEITDMNKELMVKISLWNIQNKDIINSFFIENDKLKSFLDIKNIWYIKETWEETYSVNIIWKLLLK